VPPTWRPQGAVVRIAAVLLVLLLVWRGGAIVINVWLSQIRVEVG